jgi:hypothetical protein
MLEKRRLIVICVVMALMGEVLVSCGHYTGISIAVWLGYTISVLMLLAVISVTIDITRD